MLERALIGVEFFLVLAFILDQIWVVFTIVRILFLINRMHTAPVFPVAMGMVHLRFTGLEETPSEFRKTIGGANIYVKRVELMRDALVGFRQAQFVALDLIRRSNKNAEIF